MRQISIYTIILLATLNSCSRPLVEVFENYEKNSQRIDALSMYFNKIRPDSIDLWIRFNDENTTDIVLWDKREIKTRSEIFDQSGFFKNYGASVNDSLTQEVLKVISFNQLQLDSLKTLLKEVNCNSIGYKFKFWDIRNAGGRIDIGFPTHDLYGLDYIIMDSVKDAKFLKGIENKCNYKVINNKTLLKYGGPAWGSDCFPDKK